MTIGFNSYDEPDPIPTTQELLALLTGTQRTGILNSFAERKSPTDVKIEYGIRRDVVIYFYVILREMDIYAAQVMRGEIGGVSPPADQAGLVTEMDTHFTDFNTSQITAIVNKLIDYSKSDGTGDWVWYSTKVIE